MICANNPLLDDVELLMALDGETSREVAMHVSQCPQCSQRSAELASAQRLATARLFRATCPSALELGEYRLGMLPAARTTAVQQHVAVCPHCTEEMAQLTAFMDAPDPLLHPTLATAIKKQVQVLVARLASGPQLGSLFGQPALAPAYAGLRGAGDEPLIYEAGETQISIEVQEDALHPGYWAIVGLLSDLGEEPATHAGLWRDQRAVASAQVDEIGNFSFASLEPGDYELFISGAQLDIHVQSLPVGKH
jgi:hypothetical protein